MTDSGGGMEIFMKVTALIVAGGSGSRMGAGKNKVFLPLGGKTVIEKTLDVFFLSQAIDEAVIVTRKEDMTECKMLFADAPKRVTVTEGGATRRLSVYNGLRECRGEIVVIHDAARPLVNTAMIEESIRECEKNGAAAVGVECVDTLKTIDGGYITGTVDRSHICRIQTPQTFFLKDIKETHRQAEAEGFEATDDCALYEKYKGKIKLVPGSTLNIKITYADDLKFAEEVLKGKR